MHASLRRIAATLALPIGLAVSAPAAHGQVACQGGPVSWYLSLGAAGCESGGITYSSFFYRIDNASFTANDLMLFPTTQTIGNTTWTGLRMSYANGIHADPSTAQRYATSSPTFWTWNSYQSMQVSYVATAPTGSAIGRVFGSTLGTTVDPGAPDGQLVLDANGDPIFDASGRPIRRVNTWNATAYASAAANERVPPYAGGEILDLENSDHGYVLPTTHYDCTWGPGGCSSGPGGVSVPLATGNVPEVRAYLASFVSASALELPNGTVPGFAAAHNYAVTGLYQLVPTLAPGDPGYDPTAALQPDDVIPDPTGNPAAPPTFAFDDAQSGAWFDPPSASGFTYAGTNGTLFTGVGLPTLPGQASYDVCWGNGFGQCATVNAGSQYFFLNALDAFRVSGIVAPVDPTDASAFPTQLYFEQGTGNSFTMTAVLPATETPEPTTWALTGIGLVALGGFAARRRATV